MLVSVGGSIKSQDEVALRNMIGSNIFNILGILGLFSLLSREGMATMAEHFLKYSFS